MRLIPLLMTAAVAGGIFASPVIGQQPDSQIDPRSVQLVKLGEQQLAAGNFKEAEDALETALAVDPRNRTAFVDAARVAQKQALPGKAIRFTNKALLLEPNDLDAIAVQGQAMVELGAVPRAKENLAKLQKLCPSGCVQLAALNAAISHGPAVASAKVPETPKTN
jgi:cytochrome c-type biogenesis protein CcmH/NrfG